MVGEHGEFFIMLVYILAKGHYLNTVINHKNNIWNMVLKIIVDIQVILKIRIL